MCAESHALGMQLTIGYLRVLCPYTLSARKQIAKIIETFCIILHTTGEEGCARLVLPLKALVSMVLGYKRFSIQKCSRPSTGSDQVLPRVQSATTELSLPLEEWCVGASRIFSDLSLAVCSSTLPQSPRVLLCTQKNLCFHPPAGLISRVRVVVSLTGEYEIQVLFKVKEKGKIISQEQLLQLLERLSKSGSYKFCPGLGMESYHENYAKVLGYDYKSVRLMSEPFSRVDSPRCELWHKLARNSSIFERDRDEVLCQPCKKMKSHLDQRVRAASAVTPTQKVARQEPLSKCPLVALSPASQKKRRQLDERTPPW